MRDRVSPRSMETSWQVVRHTEKLVELERFGEMLEIERPDDPKARLIFVQLRGGESKDAGTVRLLTGGTNREAHPWRLWDHER